MSETFMANETLSNSQKNMEEYMKTHDVKYIAEDAVYINLATGEESHGREAIGGMLNYIYHVAFDAKAETINYIITEDKAMFEGFFTGKHIGEFAGIQPTNKQVNVPICVSYNLENGLIKKGRIYFLVNVLISQLQG